VISAFALLALPLAAEPHSTNQNAFADLPSKQSASVPVVLPAVTNQSPSAKLSLFSTEQDYQLRCGDSSKLKYMARTTSPRESASMNSARWTCRFCLAFCLTH